MKTTTICTAIVLWLLAIAASQAQETTLEKDIKILENLKEQVIQEEKDALKNEVESITQRLENDNITAAEAEELKQKAAEKRALNIENRVAIIDNKIALAERNEGDNVMGDDTDRLVLRIGRDDNQNDSFWYVGRKNKPREYDLRTSSDFVFAVGLNNVITEGESLEDSDFKTGGSKFAELGWAWKTRVFKESNWLRIKYGFSFQFNGLKPTGNRYYVDTGAQTELQEFPVNLDKSKFRMDNLVFPVHFEIGPSEKIEKEDYFRYNTYNKIKFGIGAYAGFNLGVRQKLKFEEDGDDVKQKLKGDYNTNNFVYGLSTYIGWRETALYLKYDLNTIFKDNPVDQRNVSLGLRFDLD
ncbi:hypothetical protein [Cochleicola gelatinilyticus]|uniref:Outer membrane protein beta-barrel domain-containing protein n=1 Tax=Cochleicola gelatinilyticus TaxID=1763537 RepID=A0A167EZV3_9FLAO|nr:hypothetical protein [Cochleicola gelatinilyticus]OAB76049.1 hypothetical protein ULVI_13385 [Cochleicola gelatinilyticus]